MKKVRLYEGFHNIDEASRGAIHKAVKQGSYPVTIVVIENGEVVHQEIVDTPQAVPATFNVLQKEYPNAKIDVEDRGGKILFQEGVEESVELSESLVHGFYQFSKSSQMIDKLLPEGGWLRGEVKYAVVAHNTVQMGRDIMYLKGMDSGIGKNFEAHIISIHNSEDEAFRAYIDAAKGNDDKAPANCVSYAYGVLKSKGSGYPFDEIGGERRRLK